jgi:hypothetical protein
MGAAKVVKKVSQSMIPTRNLNLHMHEWLRKVFSFYLPEGADEWWSHVWRCFPEYVRSAARKMLFAFSRTTHSIYIYIYIYIKV